MQNFFIQAIGKCIKGAMIGIANTIPGVSGGTVAVTVNIYNQLLQAISTITSKQWKQSLETLIPVGIGAAAGIYGFSWIISKSYTYTPMQTQYFFMGLIIGSIPCIYQQIRVAKTKAWHVTAGIIAFSLLVIQAEIGNIQGSSSITTLAIHNIPRLFGAGMLAAATMIIPGISGSFILLLLGLYHTVIEAVNTLNIPVLLIIGFGALIGIIAASKLIILLLKHQFALTYWIILGLVAGSVISLWPGIPIPLSVQAIGINLTLLIFGFAAATVLGSKRKHK